MEASFFIKNNGDETLDYFEAFLYRSNDLDFKQSTDHSYGREEMIIKILKFLEKDFKVLVDKWLKRH